MSDPRALSRAAGDGRPAAPVRLAHLGLGNFFRAHQAWYTDRSPDAREWGYAAFTGRSAALAEQMSAQHGLYTLVTRAPDGDRFDVVASVSSARPAADTDAWLRCLAAPQLAVVTLTVTEAGYLRRPDGSVDADHGGLRADLQALRADPAALVRTVPARLVAGLAARRAADAGPLTLVPCDNLPHNGTVLARVVREAAELLDPALADWVDRQVAVSTSVVDRITPRTTARDVATVAAATGRADACPVVTEPFTEWVLAGAPADRPAWQVAGVTLTDDVEPFEQRKLWLLNGAHCLLAYTGAVRGHTTVAEAVADRTCRGWTEQWWDEASRHLALPASAVADYRAALVTRFANPRMHHLLAQIAADGSVKLPVRLLPVLRAERAAGRVPSGAVHALAGWACHLRDAGRELADPREQQLRSLAAGPFPAAVRAVLGSLDAALADDGDLVAAVADAAGELRQP